MSLRSVGSQLLQTAPNSLLAGASKVSASFWVRVNPGNNVAGSGSVEIFGDTAGVFSATLSGTSTLRLQWSSNNGQSALTSACTVGLTPGTSYHVATTWQAGSQQYYLNGVLYKADTQGGSLGVMGKATARPFRLGSDQAGTDVTMDQPTLWIGYALTAQDAIGLRNRTIQPAGVAPSSIALEWSLAGPDGVAAQVGDAGLADASPSGLALSSIVGASPTYQAGDLTYVATATIARAVAAPSGKSVVLFAEDGEGTSTGITSIPSSNEIQTIQLVGTPAGNAFTLTFKGQLTAPLPTTTQPPSIYLLWTFPTIVGHAYNVAVNWFGNNGDIEDKQFLYETMIDGEVVATTLRTGPSTTEFTDGSEGVGGYMLPWTPVTSGVSATGATMQVRCTCSLHYGMVMSGLRVLDTNTGTITYYGVSSDGVNPSANVSVVTAPSLPGNWIFQTQGDGYGGYEYYNYQGSGIGMVVVIDPGNSTADVVLQNALCALPNIEPGGVTVIDQSGIGRGNYQITFAGGLANSAQPLFTCADPAVSVVENAAGGIGATLSINGGTPMFLADCLWAETSDPQGQLPYIYFALPQSAPAIQTAIVGMLPYAQSDFWDGPSFFFDTSLSGFPVYGWSAGLTMSFAFPELPPGTYQFAVTYPNAPFTVNGKTYQPSMATQFLVRDNFGNTVATYSVDQTQAPSDYQSEGQGWKVLGSLTTTGSQNGLTLLMTTVGQSAATGGAPQIVAILDAIQMTRTSADASVIIGPDDVATVSIPANWATTQAGPIPAISGLSVSPPGPNAILPPFVADAKTMKPGYNIEPCGYGSDMVTHTNLAYLMGPMGTVQDADGNPIRFHDQYAPGNCSAIVITPGGAIPYGDIPQGAFLTGPGLFVVTWDGDVGLELLAMGTTTVVEQPGSILTGTTGNRKVYDIQFDPRQTARASCRLNITSSNQDPADPTGQTFIANLKNLKIYPPDPADPTGRTIWENPPKFHPSFLYKMAGMRSFRTMDVMNTNSNSTALISHYKPETYTSRIGANLPIAPVAIASVQEPAAGTSYFPAFGGPRLHVTTATPHNFYEGCIANFVNAGTAQFASGNTTALTNSAGGPVHVIDDHNLIVCVFEYELTAMTNTLTGGTLIAPIAGTSWSLQDVVDLVEAVPTITDLHFNFSITTDTKNPQGARAIAAFFANNLRPGVKFHAEVGNECWNPSFITHSWCSLMNPSVSGGAYGYEYEQFYANQVKAVHDEALIAFTAAGRPGDLVHLYGTFTGQPGVTALILAQAAANGATVDEVCVATYVNVFPGIAAYAQDQLPVLDKMTVDHLLDYLELNAVHGGYPEFLVANEFPVLQQYGYGNAKVIAYEGGWGALVATDPAGVEAPGNTPNFVLRQNAVKRHPRTYWALLQYAQAFQDAGLSMWNYFHIGGGPSYYCWDSYESGNQQRGTGDPVADAINITNPNAKNLILNEAGGAWHYWSTLVPSTGSPTTTPEKTGRGRNGRIRTTGLPKGVFRTTRGR